MTQKQKLKSIEKKMERIQNLIPSFDFKLARINKDIMIKVFKAPKAVLSAKCLLLLIS